MIEFRSVSKSYGTTQALDSLSCVIPVGATVGLIGPNGSGKTTALRLLTTLIPPTSGDIIVAGHSVNEQPAAVRNLIGYMPDTFGVYESMTATEYLDFYARCGRMPPDVRARTIPAILGRVGLIDAAQTAVMSLSRGMAQRLSLGRALLHDPTILVLDEPASGLDPRARIELRNLLHELHQHGKTILISSHILSDLADLCTHMLILEHGKTIAYDTLVNLTNATRQQTIQVSVLAEVPAFAAIVATHGYTSQQSPDDACSYTLHGSNAPADRAALLHALIQAGITVHAFAAAESALEQAFLQMTSAAQQAQEVPNA
jgi:ABC-2 type transport system ATP-binding protein